MTPSQPVVERAYKRYRLEEALSLFHHTYHLFGLELIPDSTIGRTYLVEHTLPPKIAAKHPELTSLGIIRVLVLGRSSEWYKYRLNTYADAIDAVVCATHDSCLPIPVFALDVVGTYFPPDKTRYYPFDKIPARFWHTERGHKMLLGALMRKLPEAERVLATFRPRTRFYMEHELKQLLLRRPGRPIAGASFSKNQRMSTSLTKDESQ